MLNLEEQYYEAKDFVIKTFGVSAAEDEIVEDEYFCCPECNEPLYFVDYNRDWDGGAPWSYCPVCGYDWYNDTYGDYEEEDDYDEV